ncbi:MAG: sodium:calcium antiporter, partial [Kiritimatiellia bacterium]
MTDLLAWGPSWLFPVIALLGGLFLLIRSSDVFVEGAAGVAAHFGISAIVIGMVIVGFGTSAPELVVSAFSALEGKPSLALGNAFGSNIANIALIIGVTALIKPIQVHSNILRRELPLLSGVTVVTLGLMLNQSVTRLDAVLLLLLFVVAMSWTVWISFKRPQDELLAEVKEGLPAQTGLGKSLFQLVLGLSILIVS